MQVIVYTNNEGKVSVCYPTGELPVEEVARKDVPAGVPYKIVLFDTLPTDMTFFDAWEVDMSNPDGIAIGADAWIAEQAAIKAAEEAAAEAEQLAQQQAQEEVANDNN